MKHWLADGFLGSYFKQTFLQKHVFFLPTWTTAEVIHKNVSFLNCEVY